MTRTCNNCGWVHFGVSRKFAIGEVNSFKKFYDKLSRQEQLDFYGGKTSSLRNYEHCFNCDSVYTNFRDSVPGDCPDGCTLQPIIYD